MGGTGHDFTRTSYELRFENAFYDFSPEPKALAQGWIRLDFRAEGTGYTAVATLSRGEPTVLAVAHDENRVTLGEGLTTGNNLEAYPWTQITIERAAGGELYGPVGAVGAEVRRMGPDTYWTPVRATGSIRPDATVPEFVISQDMVLPWDPIDVFFTEGVDASGLEARLHVTDVATGQSPLVVWQHAPAAGEPAAWAGTVNVYGRLQHWPDAGGQMTLRIDAGVSDRAGLLAPAGETTFSFISFAAATGRNDFADTSPAVALFNAQRLGADSGCEDDGCVLSGTLDDGFCPLGGGLIAGRVVTTEASLSFRYRVLIGAEAYAVAAPVGLPRFAIETVRPGGEAETTLVRPDAAQLEELSEPQGKLRWATPWTTATIATSSAGDTGFSVRGSWDECRPPSFEGPSSSVVPMAILIDWVGG